MTRRLARAAPALAALLLAACGSSADDRTAEGSPTEGPPPRIADGPDPAVAAALAAPIMVDPALTRSANAHSIRPPDRPRDGAVPPGTGRAGMPR